MTYGWAILSVLLVMGSLVYFINPTTFLPEKCVVTTSGGLLCEQWGAATGNVDLLLRNVMDKSLTVTDDSYIINKDGAKCFSSTDRYLANGAASTVRFNRNVPAFATGCEELAEEGNKLGTRLNIGLRDSDGFVKRVTGELVGRVAGGTASPICGDGKKQGGEACDDGNNNNGDGCSASCTEEEAGPGVPYEYCGDDDVQDPNHNGESEECDDGNTVSGDGCSKDCRDEYCGDKLVNDGIETCDDGKHCEDLSICSDHADCAGIGDEICVPRAGDGCNAYCKTEGVAAPGCGDGELDVLSEECDDGNTDDGDGCSSDCRLENPAVCGDGNLDPGEECDDGNNDAGDLCDPLCQSEPTPPGGVCGDSIVQAPNGEGFDEQCDDGSNGNDDDECYDDCTRTFCGDNIIQTPNGFGANEECEDNSDCNVGEWCDAACECQEGGGY